MKHLRDYQKLDAQLECLNLQYESIDITYIVRNHIIATIRKKNNSGNVEIELNKSILKRFLKTIISTFHNLFKKKPIWVFSNAERRKKIGSEYYDRVASMVSEAYSEVLYVENPVISPHKKPSKDLVISDAIFYLGAFLFAKVYYNKKALYLDSNLATIAKEHDIQLKIEPIVKRFVGQYHFMRWYLKYVSKPEKVFLVYPIGYYGYNYAFKEINIPIIELQHGVIYPMHPSYNTVLFESSQKFKPDYIFTYGIKDKECLIDLNYVHSDKIKVVGSYGLWKIKQEKAKVSTYLESQIKRNNKTVVIVATSNDVKELYEWCLTLEKEYSNLNILLLPRFQMTNFINTNNVKVLDTNATNIFETYEIADFLITKNSTAALEALFMGIPTFIYNPVGESIFKRNYGYLKSLNYFKDAFSFRKVIEGNTYKKPFLEDIEQVYSRDVKANFKAAVKQI